MMKPLIFIQISLYYIIFIQSLETSTLLPTCSLLDSECLTEKARETLPAFIEASPELIKLHLDPVKASEGKFNFDWYNITMEGLKDAVIDNISVSMHYKILRVEFHTTIVLKQKWDANGLVFSTIPLRGIGGATIVLKNMQMEMVMPFDIIKNEQGENIMDLKTHFYGFDVDSVHYDMDNLFDGDQEEGELFHQIINNNWRTVMSNYGKYLSGKLPMSIFKAIKSFLHSVPLSDGS